MSHKALSKSSVSLMKTMNRERSTGGSDLPVPRSIIPSFSLCSVCASSQCQATPMNQGSRKLVGGFFFKGIYATIGLFGSYIPGFKFFESNTPRTASVLPYHPIHFVLCNTRLFTLHIKTKHSTTNLY